MDSLRVLGRNLTTAGAETIHRDVQLDQGNASSEGSFGLTGTFTFDDTCFRSGNDQVEDVSHLPTGMREAKRIITGRVACPVSRC
jgi:hypothetical protein